MIFFRQLPLIYLDILYPSLPHSHHHLSKPTSGIYRELSKGTLVFIHGPWNLDPLRLLDSTWILASHQRFDVTLTGVHNEPFMRRSGVVGDMTSIVGYMEDPARKMGFVAQLPERPFFLWLKNFENEEF